MAFGAQEELGQTERAISAQTGEQDERLSRLGLMRMELEGEVKELEAQLEAKRAALGEVRGTCCGSIFIV